MRSLERRSRRRRAPRRPGPRAPRSAARSRRRRGRPPRAPSVVETSCVTSANSSPSADVTPGWRGTSTSGISSPRARSTACMRAGAAEREEGELARIEAALHGHHPQPARHVGVGDADDPGRGLLDVQAQAVAEARRPRRGPGPTSSCRSPARPRSAESRPSTRLASVIVASRAAAPVGRRARHRAGALRPDLGRAGGVDPGDRAAARAHRHQVDGREADGQAELRHGLPGQRRAGPSRTVAMSALVPPMSMVSRLRRAGRLADRRGRDDAGRRARRHRAHGQARHRRRRLAARRRSA